MSDIATLYGKPLHSASSEDVARALAGARRALDGMSIFDPEMERKWVETIVCLTAELVRRELPVT